MNVWKCGAIGCPRLVIGVGGAVGLRAIGWEVTFGRGAAAIRCPTHYAGDGLEAAVDRAEISRRMENIQAATEAIQEEIYTELDRAFLAKKSNLLFVPLRKFRR